MKRRNGDIDGEREQNRKSPQRRTGGKEKKWQPYKGAWNSLLQGLSFFDTLYPSPLPPHPPYTLSHLAKAVLT